MRKFVLAMLSLALVSGCTTTFKVQELDASTQRFAGAATLPKDAIVVSETFDVDNAKRFLFLRTEFEDLNDVSGYFEGSIEKFGFFDEVHQKDDFERYVILQGLQDDIGDISGFSSLSKAAGMMGDFMFADLDLEFGTGYQAEAIMSVYDARTATEVFKVQHKVTNWAGLDGPLFRPILNSFFDWIENNSQSMQSP